MRQELQAYKITKVRARRYQFSDEKHSLKKGIPKNQAASEN